MATRASRVDLTSTAISSSERIDDPARAAGGDQHPASPTEIGASSAAAMTKREGASWPGEGGGADAHDSVVGCPTNNVSWSMASAVTLPTASRHRTSSTAGLTVVHEQTSRQRAGKPWVAVTAIAFDSLRIGPARSRTTASAVMSSR